MLAGGGGSRKHHSHGAGFLARPRLGTVKGIYSTKPLSTKIPNYITGLGNNRKMKYRKTGSASLKMDTYKKRPDPVDTAYREAVGRLKVLLAESYTVPIVGKRTFRDDSGDDTDNQSLLSSRSRHSHHHYHRTNQFINRRYPFYSTSHTFPSRNEKSHNHTDYKTSLDAERKDISGEKWNDKQPPSEMISFIQRQEDYIEQLEREAQFCRDELTGLLGKVKEVISENDNLHEKQKNTLVKSVFDHLEIETETETEIEMSKSPRKTLKKSRRLEGPSIVFESRISELEAQLTQTKIELRKCQEENENYKRKIADGTIGDLSNFDTYKIQVENLQREKTSLQDQVAKLQYELAQLKEKNSDTAHKIKRSLDVVEHAQFEKNQLESEIRRLKDELDRQHDKLRETIHEQGRRIADERAAVERRYSQQIEQLTAELGIQWETTSKLQLELDKQRREDSDVRREVAQKQAHIDELKKEIQNKTDGSMCNVNANVGVRFAASLQSDLATSSAEKGALEQQIAALHLAVERAERQGKAEANRLQAEVQSLRQRLDRADADLLHSRRENLRLSEQVASLEKELNMNALLSEEKSHKPTSSSGEPISMPALPLAAPSKDREKELTSMIKDMEAKHVATVAELEGMIQSQNQLMEKLTSECHLLTQKLEDTSNRHKEEIRELQTNLDYLSNNFKQQQANVIQSSLKDDEHNVNVDNQRPAQHPNTQLRRNTPDTEQTSSPSPSASSVMSTKHISPPAHKPSVVKDSLQSVEHLQTEYIQDETKNYHPTEQSYPAQNPEYQDEEYQQYSQQYDTQKQDYPMHQQYPENPQYITDDQYQNDQYLNEQQYSDSQYASDQQYQQQYDIDQKYTAQQDYPMEQQYTIEQYSSEPSDQPHQQETYDNPNQNPEHSLNSQTNSKQAQP